MPRSPPSGSKGQALATLKNLSGFLDASIGSLSAASVAANASRPDTNSASIDAQVSLSTILTDLHNLFALISKETTNLSLAFAPPKEHWDAVDATARKLHDLSSTSIYGLSLLRKQTGVEDVTEHILAKQWRLASVSVYECLKELSNLSMGIYASLGEKAIQPSQRKLILTNTSLVWKAIERTEKLPKDERGAFIIAWKQMLETFEDALEEAEELTKQEVKGKGKAEDQDQDQEGLDEGNQDEGESDGESEGEFDFGDLEEDDGPISEHELNTVQAAYQYMKLIKALLRKLGTLQDSALPYGKFADFGEQIASHQDELVSALHPPQDSFTIRRETRAYRETVSALIRLILENLSSADLSTSLQSVSLGDTTSGKAMANSTDSRRWFAACQEHLDKASLAVVTLCEDERER